MFVISGKHNQRQTKSTIYVHQPQRMQNKPNFFLEKKHTFWVEFVEEWQNNTNVGI